MQLLPQGLFLVLPLSLPSTPYCPRRPSLKSLPSHRLAVSNRGTNVKPRAIGCCHFYTARCTCRLQLMEKGKGDSTSLMESNFVTLLSIAESRINVLDIVIVIETQQFVGFLIENG
ncbi:unnamed protein product [Musa acuminata var. zebrina]